jgi:hypothetical protein
MRSLARQASFVLLYLTAIVLANLSTAYFGPSASIVNAFLFIGLDLTSRDKMHDAWCGYGFVWKMGALIATGSLLSWLLNRNAGAIALASFVAFAAAALVDTLAYHVLRERTKIIRINGSNVLSAAVDSLVFPTLAFGVFALAITAGQFAAKVLGGYVWSLILRKAALDAAGGKSDADK